MSHIYFVFLWLTFPFFNFTQEEHASESQKLKDLSSKLAAEVQKASALETEILDFKVSKWLISHHAN